MIGVIRDEERLRNKYMEFTLSERSTHTNMHALNHTCTHQVKCGNEIGRIVVARDGRFVGDEIVMATMMIEMRFPDCILDFVEVTKSGPDLTRILNVRSEANVEIPHSGSWYAITQDSAILISTGAPKNKRTAGVPRPILISKVNGHCHSSLAILLYEMFMLTQVETYCKFPTRMPIHLHLCDRLAYDARNGIKYPNDDGIHPA